MAQGAAVVHGIGVGRSVAVGRVLAMPAPLAEPEQNSHGGDAAAEKAVVAAAVESVADELRARADRAEGAGRAIIEAGIQMARDPMLAADIAARIEAGATGERAVFEAFRAFQQQLTALGGDLAERATDLGDVAQRVIAAIRGVPVPGVPESDVPFVLLADDLAPADTALLDLTKVLGLITRGGGPTSHTAILARAQGIPAVIAIGAHAVIAEGALVILDAASGTVTVGPSEAQVADAEARIAERASRARGPDQRGRPGRRDEDPLVRESRLPREAAEAIALGAEGVGLFRTEFLFLDAKAAPSVADQQAQYRELLSQFAGKKVVVRVLDSGADKPLAFLDNGREDNPALGLRGLRGAARPAADPDRSAAGAQERPRRHRCGGESAELWVMAPMVADAGEARYFVDLAKGLGLQTVGVMAEVPSLALVADQVLADRRFREHRHQRPDPVHAGGRPDARHSRRLSGPVASRRAAPGQDARGCRRSGRQAGRHLRGGRCRPRTGGGSGRTRSHQPLDGARGTRRRAGRIGRRHPRTGTGESRRGARGGVGRGCAGGGSSGLIGRRSKIFHRDRNFLARPSITRLSAPVGDRWLATSGSGPDRAGEPAAPLALATPPRAVSLRTRRRRGVEHQQTRCRRRVTPRAARTITGLSARY